MMKKMFWQLNIAQLFVCGKQDGKRKSRKRWNSSPPFAAQFRSRLFS